MRVLLLSWEYPPSSVGGMAGHVDGLAHALTDACHEVVVITRRSTGTEPDSFDGLVRVLRADIDLPWVESGAIAATSSANHHFVAMASMLDGWVPDVVHANDWNVAWAADTLAQLWHRRLVTTFHGTARGRHGGHIPQGTPTEINNVEWWLAFRSQRVIAVTGLLGRTIVEGFEIDPGQVVHVPVGIDPTWWQADDPADLTETRSNFVFAWGRVQYEKGFQTLAQAMPTVRQQVDGAHASIAGRGSYLPELQSQIDIAQAGDLIDLPGYVTDTELRQAVHLAACVVIPSLYEPFGVVALEALAGGAPLIVSDTGGLAELVKGTGAALTFEPGNADALAARIVEVLSNPGLGAELASYGRTLLAERYSWQAIAERTVAVYEAA